VLSQSVSKVLYFTKNRYAFETAYIIDKMDKFFSALNVPSFTSGKHHRKPFQLSEITQNGIKITSVFNNS